MIRKSDVVRSLVADRQYKKALRIAKRLPARYNTRTVVADEESIRMYGPMSGSTYPWVKTRKPE